MPGPLQPDFGIRLRTLRTRAGLKQTDLARSGLTQSYLSHLEAGRREPTAGTIAMLGRLLEVPAEAFTGQASVPEAAGLVLLGRADMLKARGDAAGAQGLYEQALNDDTLMSSDDWLRPVLALAEAEERRGDLDAAVRRIEKAFPRAAADCDHGGQDADPRRAASFAALGTALARCYREAGDLSRAVDVASSAAASLSEVRPRPNGYAELIATLAAAHALRGDLLRASQLLDDLLADAQPAQDSAAQAAAHWNAGLVAAERGRPLEALRLMDRAAWLVARQDNDRALARVKVSQAWLLLAPPAPDPLRAEALLREALPEVERHASRTDLASARTELARACLALGRADEAAEHARAAEGLLSDQPNLESARAAAVLGQSLLALGESAAGCAQLDRSARLLSGFGSTREAAGLWRILADAYAATGRADQALQAFRYAMDTLGVQGEGTTVDPLLTAHNAGV